MLRLIMYDIRSKWNKSSNFAVKTTSVNQCPIRHHISQATVFMKGVPEIPSKVQLMLSNKITAIIYIH